MATRVHRIAATYRNATPETLDISDWSHVIAKIEGDELGANHGLKVNGGEVMPLEVGESFAFFAAPGTQIEPVTDMGASTETVAAAPVFFTFLVTDLPITEVLDLLRKLASGEPSADEAAGKVRDPEHSSMGARRSRYTR